MSTFVGRQRELEELRVGLADALAGRGRVFLIVGEPGMGKTRLAEEVAAAGRAAGARVLWGRCWEGGGAPAFWPWIQVLRLLIGDRDPAWLTRHLGAGAAHLAALVPELRQHLVGIADEPHSSAIESEHARFPLFDATATFLQRVATEQPLIIVLDDLHEADDPSLLLLQFVAREARSARVLLIGTYREVEIQRQPSRARQLSDIARNGHRLPLSGWSEAEVAQFIHHTFAPSPTPAAVSRLHRITAGNPFFVDEVVRLLVSEGHELRADEAAERWPIPPGIREVTRERLRPLSPDCRRVLTIAAVMGGEFSLLCLQRASELPLDRVLDVLNEAQAAGVVTRAAGVGSGYAFAHVLIRQTLYDDLPTVQRLHLHQRIGKVLETLSTGDPDAHIAELAHHFFQAAPAGTVDQAVAYGVRAGQRAVALLAYEEAAARYARVLEALALKPPADHCQQIEVLLALGDAQARAWQSAPAHATFLHAADLARRTNARQLFARAVLGLGGAGFGLPRGSVVDSALVALLEEALAGLDESDDALRARVLARLGVELYFSDAEERRAALSKEAVDAARRSGDAGALAYTINARHFALWNSRDVDERLAIANEGIELAERAGDRDLAAQAHTWRLLDLIETGAAGEWERELALCCRLADELRQPRYMSMAATLRAMRALWLGHFDELDGIGQQIVALAERAHDGVALASVAFQMCMAHRAQGRYEMCEALARSGAQQFPTLPVTRCMSALIELDLGHIAAARRAYEGLATNDFADLVRVNGLDSLLPPLAELCAHFGDTHGATLLYERLLRFTNRTISFGPRFCFGPASHALGLLANMMGRHSTAARHFDDALTTSTALGGQPAVATTSYEYARVLLARNGPGDGHRALDLATRAHDIAQSLGMTPLAAKAGELVSVLRSKPDDNPPIEHEALHRAVGYDGSMDEVAASESGEGGKARVIRFPGKHSRVQSAAARGEPQPTAPAVGGRSASGYVFRLEGEFWTVGEAPTVLRLKDTKGLRYIAQLLRHPSTEFHAVDLAAGEHPHRPAARSPAEPVQQLGLRSIDVGDLGALLDPQAKAAYKRRLRSLREELDEATRFNDRGRVTKAQHEIDFISRELARAVGLHGRDRAGATHAERARINVTRAIKAVVKRISARNPSLGRSLATTVKTGTYCCYTPDPHQPITWNL